MTESTEKPEEEAQEAAAPEEAQTSPEEPSTDTVKAEETTVEE